MDIAQKMNMSEYTIHTILKTAVDRMNARSLHEAISIYTRQEVGDP